MIYPEHKINVSDEMIIQFEGNEWWLSIYNTQQKACIVLRTKINVEEDTNLFGAR